MNKKLFTLAAALMMGSAFTVNAQKKEVVDKTALNGGTWYFLAVPGVATPDPTTGDVADRVFVGGMGLTDSDGNKHTILNDNFLKRGTATVAGLSRDETTPDKDHYDSYLWKVSMSSMNGTNYYTLTNKKTGKNLVFAAAGTVGIASDHSVNAVTWAGMNPNGSYNPTTAGIITTAGSSKINVTSSAITYVTGTALHLYTIDEAPVIAADLNKGLGDGFALSFPDVKPQPAKNIFDQKLTAVNYGGYLYVFP